MILTFQSLCIGSLGIIGLFVCYALITGSSSLRRFIVARVVLTPLMIWILVTVVFVFMRVLPGDPIKTRMKPGTDPVKIAQIRESLGLNDPIHVQYVHYLVDMLHGDFGVSYVGEERPVARKISERMPATIELVIPASLLTLLVGVASGAYAADKRKKAQDVAIRLGAVFVYSIPIFWMGLLFQMIFSLKLGWLPVAGRIDPKIDLARHTNLLLIDSILTNHAVQGIILFFVILVGIPLVRIWPGLVKRYFSGHSNSDWLEIWLPRIHLLSILLIVVIVSLTLSPNWRALGSVIEHLILPVFTLSLALVGVFVRLTRANMIETLQEDFVTAARARGVPERKVIYFHALHNTFIPILTLIGLQVAILFAGAVLTETTFSWPGMGLMLRDGIALRDYPLVQGGVTVFAIMIAITTLLMDILYAFVDPRIRY
jgi:peptide/nickel transport system permease protein